MTTPAFSLAYLVTVREVQYHLVSAFTVIVWDLLLTFDEEVEYIWRMRRCVFKWFYFYFRYFLLAAQMFHVVILPSLSSGRTSDRLCMIWYQYLTFILLFSMSMIEIILATRVFALFSRNRKIGIFLSSLLLVQSGFALSSVVHCSAAKYFEACILPYPRKEITTPMTSIVIIVHTSIMGMLIYKHFVGVRLGWGRTPLLSFLVRDATHYYVIIFVICIACLAVCGLDELRGMVTVYWLMSLFSAIGCHLILNMERFARGNPSDEEILFTTHISL